MNRHDWLITISSCEGHENHEIHNMPYVAFECKMSKIDDLCKLLDEIEIDIDAHDIGILMELSIVFSSVVHGSQDDVPKGWVSLHLAIDIHDDKFADCKKYVLDRLTDAFVKAKKTETTYQSVAI